MSRAPPFPTRRRSPSVTTGNSFAAPPSSAPGTSATRPLQVSRPGSRPTTPVNSHPSSSPAYAPNTAPLGPSRPQRSELRARIDYAGSERVSTSSQEQHRDSIARSEEGTASAGVLPSRQRLDLLQSPTATFDDGTTPTSLKSALSAFQSAGSRRRQTPEDSEEYYYKQEREREIEVEKSRQQRIRDRAPGVARKGTTRGGEIDAVLDQVKDGWEFVIDPNFNNVDLALQLLDKSSLGKDIESFRRTKNMLSKALKGSVDKHYQAFAASLPHHASLLSHLGTAQSEVAGARSALLEAKEALGGKRADLVQLWNRGQMLEEMIRILDQIEHLKTVPDLLETLMSEKRLLQASILLIRSLKIINKMDMQEIGAVADLRSYLNSQETALREILIEELQSHLYLKSFWCESRWAAYVPNQRTFPKVEFDVDDDLEETSEDPGSPSISHNRLTKFLNTIGLRPNDPPYDMEDGQYVNGHLNGSISAISGSSMSVSPVTLSSSLNPEADSFTYMETLLESLAVLGKLGNALDNVAQRFPSEIFALIETTLAEVEERAEFGRRRSISTADGNLGAAEGTYLFVSDNSFSGPSTVGSRGPHLKSCSLRLAALESLAKRIDHEILKDFFWTLYSKLDAVAQGLRVVNEVATRIGSRRDYKDSSGTKPGTLFPLQELWNHVQSEVRTLISDYLTDEQRGSVMGRNPISSINEILRDGKFNKERIKPVFRFSDTDLKLTNKALRPHEDGLTRVLKDTMPGLAPNAAGESLQTIVNNNVDDRLLGADQHHRLLISPDAFHVTVLFQPTLCYLQRVSEIFPSGLGSAQASSAVLDEFVLTVYLPQLEEKVSDLFHDAVTGSEAFLPDPLSLRLSPQPVAKVTTYLMALINSLCGMLNTSPFHRENYSRLILGVVIQFYQRCSDRFQTLTTVPAATMPEEPLVVLAAQWAQRSELQPCFMELRCLKEYDQAKLRQLYQQETNIESEFLEIKTIAKEDLMPSLKSLAGLASLHQSVSWFSAEISALKSKPEDPKSTLSPSEMEATTGFTPSFPNIPFPLPETEPQQLNLPLSREMALRFQALLRTYDQLSTLTLDTIRVDIRCRTMYYLCCAMRHGTYNSLYEAVEPDPYIADLNTELVQLHEFLSASLPETQRRYSFAGLGQLMEHILITHARELRIPNDFGIRKIMRNILALQQCIISLTDDPTDSGFERAKRYYSLYFISPQEMLDGIRQRQEFTFEEYQVMLDLQCGVDPTNNEKKPRDRNYSTYMIDLHGMEMDKSN